MKNLLTIDEKNYDPTLSQINRIAVRGIFSVNNKLVFIESDSGELKIPGGGMEENESDLQTLIREVQEETGYIVKPDSVKTFGEIIERRMAKYEPMIWNQINRLYFCQVEQTQTNCNYTQHEKALGYKIVYKTLEGAIAHNTQYLTQLGENPQTHREYKILELIKNSYL